MNKIRFSFLNLTLAVFVFSFPNFLKPYIASCEEQITITTYYPAPYGIYRELRADQMAIGSAYRTTALSDGNLIVSGNVGIGRTSPAASLDISGDILTGGNRIEVGYSTAGNKYSYIDFRGDNTYTDFGLRLLRYSDGANAASILQHRGTGILYFYANEAAPMYFYTNNSFRMALDSSGRLGIGTASPSAPLHVSGAANTCLYVTYHSSSGDQPCPGNTFLIFPSITIPETSGYFICCRACSDGVGAPAPDGSCDSTAWT